MDNFDCLTVVISHVDDLETILSLREANHNLCSYILKNLKIIALRLGITEDVIDFQNFIYQYARIRLTVTPRIVSEKRLLKLALLEDNIPMIEKYKILIARYFKLCRSLEALEVMISSCGEQSKYFYIPIPYIPSIELPRLVETIKRGTGSSMFDIRYYADCYIKDNRDRIDHETYAEICRHGCCPAYHVHELLPLIFSNFVPETLKETPPQELEILLEGVIKFFPNEDTTLIEYILELGNFVGTALCHAIQHNKYKIVLFLMDKISIFSPFNMSKFSYNADIIVEIIGKLTKFVEFKDFCSNIMKYYIPVADDTRVYDKIREMISDKMIAASKDQFQFARTYYITVFPTVRYHPLAKAYMIKYMDCSCNHFVNAYSKEKQRKFEYYLENL